MNSSRFAFALTVAALVAPATRLSRADEPNSDPSRLNPPASGLSEVPITDSDREHWSYRPLVRPELPAVGHPEWIANPIDRFIVARLEESGLTPLPSAGRATLIRRVTFGLTGLPPTPHEVAAFLADDSPEAYERLIDRLLASPAYGEHWARHWLDLARFAETDGFEHDKVRPEAWRYRDWVIEALNRDLPYDEFVRLQLAGDEVLPGDAWAAAATGFCRAGPDMPDINLQEERRDTLLNELTSTVGAVFLGMQIGCAQCHDHKFDPVSQADFYRLRAVFEPADLLNDSPLGRVLSEPNGKPAKSFLMVRGDFRRPGPAVEPGFPRIANPWDDRPPVESSEATTSRRRTALAAWVTRPDHPLATRVIANRIWQYHFGEGLAGSPSDFGIMGDEPTQPELLDWLATELPRLGWRLKALHKLFLTSSVYRRASRATEPGWTAEEQIAAEATLQAAIAADPQNRLLARRNRVRLDGEEIRDAMLTVSGRLSNLRGGPGVMPPLSQVLVDSLLKDQWVVSANEVDHRRRSIYLFVRRNLRYPLFEVFDRPDTNASCPRRGRSTTAPQALALFNSELSHESARYLAERAALESGLDFDRAIERAWQLALGRTPTAHEQNSILQFVAVRPMSPSRADGANGTTPEDTIWEICLALFNLNEFIYID